MRICRPCIDGDHAHCAQPLFSPHSRFDFGCCCDLFDPCACYSAADCTCAKAAGA